MVQSGLAIVYVAKKWDFPDWLILEVFWGTFPPKQKQPDSSAEGKDVHIRRGKCWELPTNY
jgi:hypothetical protein